MDQFINTLHSILGTASRLTLHSSIGDISDVLIGLGILALIALILLVHETTPSALKQWHAAHRGDRPARHRWLHHRH
jgi:hypothetical protein